MIKRMTGIALAVVKPNTSGTGGFSLGTSHGRLTATNVPVRALILKGFHAKDFQVTGGPGWLETERYDVVAKTENASISDNDLWLLLRFHRETKQLPVYLLTVAKGGPKLKPHTGDDEPNMSGRTGSGNASFAGTKISMARLADMLGEHTDCIVVDNTGLKGVYDFKLDWAQEDSHEPAGISMLSSLQEGLGLAGPSIFTAVQEQLGLKLEPAKGPVQIIVIESAQRAGAN